MAVLKCDTCVKSAAPKAYCTEKICLQGKQHKMNTGNWCIYSNAILQIHFSAICKEVQRAVSINLPQCKSYCCETYDSDLFL